MTTIKKVPPTPRVVNALRKSYKKRSKNKGLAALNKLFEEIDQSVILSGFGKTMNSPMFSLLDTFGPGFSPTTVFLDVLLVDFNDRPGAMDPDHYRELFFSCNAAPGKSVNDFYHEVSGGRVAITGRVIPTTIRLQSPYRHYLRREIGPFSMLPYGQELAMEAIKAAIDDGAISCSLPPNSTPGTAYGVCIIHAGKAAESIENAEQRQQEIWSHQYELSTIIPHQGIQLDGIKYAVVAHESPVGTCAHEIGHLAFRWEDLYASGPDPLQATWDGSGSWDLMSFGCHNANGACPAHPAGMHKAMHGWVKKTTIDFGDNSAPASQTIQIAPVTAANGEVVMIKSPFYNPWQYLLLEYRTQTGFDAKLPGPGLLVWRINERAGMSGPDGAKVLLVQADGKKQLEDPKDKNFGDPGDPFPGSQIVTELLSTGNINTSFPNQLPSGIELKNIRLNDDYIELDVIYAVA